MDALKNPSRPDFGLVRLLKSLYLFGKSDIPTVILPTVRVPAAERLQLKDLIADYEDRWQSLSCSLGP